MTIQDSSISDNSARNGGGIAAYYSDKLVIERSTISQNESTGDGGGVFFDRSGFFPSGGEFHLIDSTVIDNHAAHGGGVFVSHYLQPSELRAQVILTNSTVSGNGALSNGGGAWIDGDVQVRHSTVTQNSSDTNRLNGGTGGGIFIESGDVKLDHTIVAGNHDNTAAAPEIAGVFRANRSLVGFGGNFLGPLADNGGPTRTHALLPGSPAINAGDFQSRWRHEWCAGVRSAGHAVLGACPIGRIDIGAFEYQQASDLNLFVDTLVDESDGNYSPRGSVATRGGRLANMWPSDDTIHFDPALTAGGPAAIVLAMGELRLRVR